MMLFMLSQVFFAAGFVLVMAEVLGARRLMCGCGTGFQAYRHLKSPWLYVIGICYLVSNIVGIASGGRLPIIGMLGVFYLWRAWKHSKGGRKKLKDKVLGKVSVTVAGLKVVPVGGAA